GGALAGVAAGGELRVGQRTEQDHGGLAGLGGQGRALGAAERAAGAGRGRQRGQGQGQGGGGGEPTGKQSGRHRGTPPGRGDGAGGLSVRGPTVRPPVVLLCRTAVAAGQTNAKNPRGPFVLP